MLFFSYLHFFGRISATKIHFCGRIIIITAHFCGRTTDFMSESAFAKRLSVRPARNGNALDNKLPFFPGNSKFLQNRLLPLRSDLIGMSENMKRIVLIPAAMLLWIMQAASQTGGTVIGILKEKASGLPMECASVGLHEAETKNVKNGCMTDSTGQFRFEKVPAGKYYVEGSCVGGRSGSFQCIHVGKGTNDRYWHIIYIRGRTAC